jgi:hypothetical protein
MVRRAPRAILAAFGGSTDTAAAHDPVVSAPVVTASGSTVTVSGWAIDPDAPTRPLGVTVAEGATSVAAGTTSVLRPGVNRAHHTTGTHGYAFSFDATAGVHDYCVTVANTGWGSADPTRCASVTVPGEPYSPPS